MAYFGNHQRIPANFGFHRNPAVQNADNLLLCDSELIHSFSKPKSFIHGVCSFLSFYAVLLSKTVFYGAQKLKGKHVFMKIEIIHLLHIVSSVAQK